MKIHTVTISIAELATAIEAAIAKCCIGAMPEVIRVAEDGDICVVSLDAAGKETPNKRLTFYVGGNQIRYFVKQ